MTDQATTDTTGHADTFLLAEPAKLEMRAQPKPWPERLKAEGLLALALATRQLLEALHFSDAQVKTDLLENLQTLTQTASEVTEGLKQREAAAKIGAHHLATRETEVRQDPPLNRAHAELAD